MSILAVGIPESAVSKLHGVELLPEEKNGKTTNLRYLISLYVLGPNIIPKPPTIEEHMEAYGKPKKDLSVGFATLPGKSEGVPVHKPFGKIHFVTEDFWTSSNAHAWVIGTATYYSISDLQGKVLECEVKGLDTNTVNPPEDLGFSVNGIYRHIIEKHNYLVRISATPA